MRKFERVLLVLALVLGGVAILATRGAGLGLTSAAKAQNGADGEGGIAGEFAYVSGFTILEDLVDSQRFVPEMAEVQGELEEALEPLQDEMRGLQEEFQAIQQQGQGPEQQAALQRLQREAQRIQREMQAVRGEYEPRLEELVRENIRRSWEEMRAAAQAVAESKGYRYVLMSEDPTDNVNESGVDQDGDGLTDQQAIVQEIQRRMVLVAPEGTDISADVRADLNLE